MGSSFRKFCLAVGMALGWSACAQAASLPPAAGTAPAASASLVQIGSLGRGDRIRSVSERLFAAAAPFCGGAGDCRPTVLFEKGGGFNAHAHAGKITVSRALVDLADTDDQLALVLAHELAHLLLGHAGAGQAAAMSLADGALRQDEHQADHLGLYLLARAGFEPREAVLLWPRLAAAQPQLVGGDQLHPGLAERYRAMQHTCLEIEAKHRAGRPLVPGR